MLRRLIVLLGLLAAMVVMSFSADVFADIITVTQTGIGTGKIGTTTFANYPFTIISVGNTDNLATDSQANSIPNGTATITIDGLGSYQFLTPTRTFSNFVTMTPGFSSGASHGPDLFDGPTNAVFSNWHMLTSIGPITGLATLLQWSNSPVQTSGGTLVFNNASSVPTTFQAVVIPEPSTIALLLAGAACLLAFEVRRRKPTAGGG
jgi:hypothetical protein